MNNCEKWGILCTAHGHGALQLRSLIFKQKNVPMYFNTRGRHLLVDLILFDVGCWRRNSRQHMINNLPIKNSSWKFWATLKVSTSLCTCADDTSFSVVSKIGTLSYHGVKSTEFNIENEKHGPPDSTAAIIVQLTGPLHFQILLCYAWFNFVILCGISWSLWHYSGRHQIQQGHLVCYFAFSTVIGHCKSLFSH